MRHRPFQQTSGDAAPAFIDRHLDRIDAAHLAGADRQRPVGAVKITVFDFTCAHTRQAKRSACHSVGGRLPFGHDLQPSGRDRVHVVRASVT